MDRATQPLILANNFPVVTYTTAVICLLCHLFPCTALTDEMSCHLNATTLRVVQQMEAVHIVHRTITTLFSSPSLLFLLFVVFLAVIHWTTVK